MTKLLLVWAVFALAGVDAIPSMPSMPSVPSVGKLFNAECKYTLTSKDGGHDLYNLKDLSKP